MAERKPLPKKLRFEVLKRDSFTCQYCGRQAPEVILEVDHIEPVANGGTNDITNLITSCRDCNSGKGARELSDDAVVKKKKAQLDEMQARREQLEMMREWQMDLTESTLSAGSIVSDIVKEVGGCELSEKGIRNINKLIEQFGFEEVCDATRIAFMRYDDPETAFGKIGGICWCRSHVTCYTCRNFEGKMRSGNIRCEYVNGFKKSVKVAEDCMYYEGKE